MPALMAIVPSSQAAVAAHRPQAPLASCSSSMMRSCTPASTSQALPAAARGRRATGMVVRAQDAFCRDKVNAVRKVDSKGKTYKVTFLAAGGESRTIDCRDDQYILDAAEAGGVDLPATCRGGICGACVVRVSQGTIDHSDISDLSFVVDEDEQAQGMALICMSRATSDITCETQSDWGYSLGVGEWKGASGKFTSKPDPLIGKQWEEIKA